MKQSRQLIPGTSIHQPLLKVNTVGLNKLLLRKLVSNIASDTKEGLKHISDTNVYEIQYGRQVKLRRVVSTEFIIKYHDKTRFQKKKY